MFLFCLNLQLTYAALGRADADMLQAICDCSGYKSKYGKKEIMHRMMQFGYDSFGPEVLGNKNVMQVCNSLRSVCLLNGGLRLPYEAAGICLCSLVVDAQDFVSTRNQPMSIVPTQFVLCSSPMKWQWRTRG